MQALTSLRFSQRRDNLRTRNVAYLAIIFALVANVAGLATASADTLQTRLYVGAKVLRVDSINANVLAQRLRDRGHTVNLRRHDESAAGAGISVGLMFEDQGWESGLELGYQYLDELTTSMSVVNPDIDQLGQDIADLRPQGGHSVYAAIAWMIPVTEKLQARLKYGYMRSFGNEQRLRVNNTVVDIEPQSQSGNLFSAGLRYQITPLWYMAAELDQRRMGDSRTSDVYSLAVERVLSK